MQKYFKSVNMKIDFLWGICLCKLCLIHVACQLAMEIIKMEQTFMFSERYLWQKWLRAIKRENFSPNQYSKVSILRHYIFLNFLQIFIYFLIFKCIYIYLFIFNNKYIDTTTSRLHNAYYYKLHVSASITGMRVVRVKRRKS